MLRGLLRGVRASARAVHRAHFSTGQAAPADGPSVANDALDFVVQAAKVAGFVYVLDTYVFNLSSVRVCPPTSHFTRLPHARSPPLRGPRVLLVHNNPSISTSPRRRRAPA